MTIVAKNKNGIANLNNIKREKVLLLVQTLNMFLPPNLRNLLEVNRNNKMIIFFKNGASVHHVEYSEAGVWEVTNFNSRGQKEVVLYTNFRKLIIRQLFNLFVNIDNLHVFGINDNHFRIPDKVYDEVYNRWVRETSMEIPIDTYFINILKCSTIKEIRSEFKGITTNHFLKIFENHIKEKFDEKFSGTNNF